MSDLVTTLRDFLSAEESEQLISEAKAKFKESKVSDHKLDSSYRKSATANCLRGGTTLIQTIESRLIALFGCEYQQVEPIQVEKFSLGDYYKSHYDTKFADEYDTNDGQWRVYSIIIFLNQCDGLIKFDELGVEADPLVGCAIVWKNVDELMRVNRTMLHGITGPSVGEFYIARSWIRYRAFVTAPRIVPMFVPGLLSADGMVSLAVAIRKLESQPFASMTRKILEIRSCYMLKYSQPLFINMSMDYTWHDVLESFKPVQSNVPIQVEESAAKVKEESKTVSVPGESTVKLLYESESDQKTLHDNDEAIEMSMSINEPDCNIII